MDEFAKAMHIRLDEEPEQTALRFGYYREQRLQEHHEAETLALRSALADSEHSRGIWRRVAIVSLVGAAVILANGVRQ
jgi:hypothetical protein